MTPRLSSLLFALICLATTAVAKTTGHYAGSSHAHHSPTKTSLHNGQEF